METLQVRSGLLGPVFPPRERLSESLARVQAGANERLLVEQDLAWFLWAVKRGAAWARHHALPLNAVEVEIHGGVVSKLKGGSEATWMRFSGQSSVLVSRGATNRASWTRRIRVRVPKGFAKTHPSRRDPMVQRYTSGWALLTL